MSNFTRIATQVDVAPLLAELDEASGIWLVDTSRQRKIRCQRNTQNIFLRVAKNPLPPGARNANDVHESHVSRVSRKFPRTLKFCERVAQQADGELGRVTLVALMPRSQVFPHVDAGEYYRVRDRFHLVLRSRDGSPLTAGDETVEMREGELWAFNNKARHWAINPSDEPRVHLIFYICPAPGRGRYVFPLDATGPKASRSAPTSTSM